jgi:hypothetical protein
MGGEIRRKAILHIKVQKNCPLTFGVNDRTRYDNPCERFGSYFRVLLMRFIGDNEAKFSETEKRRIIFCMTRLGVLARHSAFCKAPAPTLEGTPQKGYF